MGWQVLRQSGGGKTDDGETAEVRQSALLTIKESLGGGNLRWRFQVVGWGLSQSRHVWKPDVFTQSLKQFPWENLDAYLDHPTATEDKELPERSLQKKIGWWSDFEITPEGMDATLNLKPSAAWVGEDIRAAFEAGNHKFYAASINVAHRSKQVTWTDNKPAEEALVVKPVSIDLVTVAAANGHVRHALASRRERANSEGESMNKAMLLRIFLMLNATQFATVRQSLVTAGAEGVTADSTAEQLVDAIHENEAVVTQALSAVEETTRESATEPPPAQAARQAQPPQQQGRQSDDTGEIGFERLPQRVREGMIAQAFRDSNLPEAVQQSIRRRLGASATLDQVEAEIASATDTLAVTQESNVENPRIVVVGAGSLDKTAIALAKAFGLTREQFNGIESRSERLLRQSGGSRLSQAEQDLWNSLDPLRSIRSLYVEMTGDAGFEGVSTRPRRLTRQATWLTSDFSELIAAVTGKRLLADYRAVPQSWRRVAMVKPVSDFKTQRAVLLGYFGDLSAVNQDASYAEVSALTDTEETYAVSKRGRLVSLSLESVANDDLNGFMRIISRLGRAAARTLEKFVWNTCLMGNPTLAADSKALFHADHANLITTALGTPGLKEAITKLLSQTEPGSSEAMTVDTMNLTLAVAPGSYLDAQTLTDFNNAGGGETDALAQLVRRMGITPVNVPFFTDANDWLLAASPADIDIVEIGFFNGNEEPEFFTQADPTQGDSFAKDVVAKYKVRHIYGGAPVDYRGVVKSAVV